MSVELEVFLKIKVENEEQARRVIESVYSGYAAEIVRLGALWGQVPVMGVGNATPMDPSVAKKREAQEVTLQRVADNAGSVKTVQEIEEPTPRAKGVMGRKRMGRG